MSLIVYASKKGTSKQYALLLSEITGVHVVDVESIQYANPYKRLIFIAPMYTGKIYGIKELKDSIPLDENCEILVGVVGANDPHHSEVIEQAHRAVLTSLPDNLRQVNVHLLRGDYKHSKLTMMERLLMFGLKKKIETAKSENVKEYEREMLKFIGKDVSFFDVKYLDPLIEWIEQ